MGREIDEYEDRARECVRLVYVTGDEMLREQILCLYGCYFDYVEYLRERAPRRTAEIIQYGDWCMAHEEAVEIGDEAHPHSVG